MGSKMALHAANGGKETPTHRTLRVADAQMSFLVRLEYTEGAECLGALVALVRSLARVYALVLAQVTRLLESSGAVATFVRPRAANLRRLSH